MAALLPHHFEAVGNTHIKGIHVNEYRSTLTGVRVLLGDVDSPLVNGFFTVPTEAHDDDGCPHTLEHLVFLGSLEYPYKGVLDAMAHRCLSQGTNAWTATDHTTYTISTAGYEGFLNLLPVYLDHILRPILDDNSFITEVHHVTKKGTDAGVVYSEMEARENQAGSILERQILRSIYPEGSGYRYETGGMMANIRELKKDKIVDYHRHFYRWQNLCLIVTGPITASQLLPAVSAIEKKHLELDAKKASTSAAPVVVLPVPEADSPKAGDSKIQSQPTGTPSDDIPADPSSLPTPDHSDSLPNLERHGSLGQYPHATHSANVVQRPWVTPVPPMQKSALRKFKFPSDDEESGMLAFAWRGPKWSDLMEAETIEIIGAYLTVGSAAPLMKGIVERVDDPLASWVDFSCESFKERAFYLTLHDVPTDDFQKAVNELNSIVKKTMEAPLDMERLVNLVTREQLHYKRTFETSPHDMLADLLNEYVVNGDRFEELESLLHISDVYDALKTKDEAFWKEKMMQHFIRPPRAELWCLPSRKKGTSLQKAEAARIRVRREEWGEERLTELDALAREAAEGQVKPPTEVIESVPCADVGNVKMFDYPFCRNFGDVRSSGCNHQKFNCLLSQKEIARGTKSSPSRVVPPSPQGSNEIEIPVPAKALRRKSSDLKLSHLNERGLGDLPFYAQMIDIPSDFVKASICLKVPEDLSVEEKRMLYLLADILFECSVEDRTGSLINHEDYQNMLLEKVVTYGAQLGMGKPKAMFSDYLNVTFTGPTDTYVEATELIMHALERLRVTEERVSVISKALRSTMIKKRRNGKKCLEQLQVSMRWKDDSAYSCCALSQQEAILEYTLNNLGEATVKLQALHSKVFQPNRTLVHIAGDSGKMPPMVFTPLDQWGKGASTAPTAPPLMGLDITSPALHKVPVGAPLQYGNAMCIGRSSVDTTHLLLSVPGPQGGYLNEELPALMVMCEYFLSFEGPLYHAVRGAGFAYGFDLLYSPATGDLEFSISPATDAAMALERGLEVLKTFANGEAEFETARVCEARLCALFSIISKEETLPDYAFESLLHILRGVPPTYNLDMLRKVGAVTAEDLQVIAKKYLPGLVNFKADKEKLAEGGTLAIVTNSNKVEQLVADIKNRKIIGGIGEITWHGESDPFQLVTPAAVSSADEDSEDDDSGSEDD